ncbi:MAG: hypothetical protein KUL75_00365 [Sterolibacterium sp.]|nr:hypothetical protein [Sterolibacterium sp.]
MLANYGYQDGSGTYYIRIDTDACVTCTHHACLAACPAQLFGLITDDYDDDVVEVLVNQRQQLKEACAGCKPSAGYQHLPCTTACTAGVIEHSW